MPSLREVLSLNPSSRKKGKERRKGERENGRQGGRVKEWEGRRKGKRVGD